MPNAKIKIMLSFIMLALMTACNLKDKGGSNSNSSNGPTAVLVKAEEIKFSDKDEDISFIALSNNQQWLYLVTLNEYLYALEITNSFATDILDKTKWQKIDTSISAKPGIFKIWKIAPINNGAIIAKTANGGGSFMLSEIENNAVKAVISDEPNSATIGGLSVVNTNSKEHIFSFAFEKWENKDHAAITINGNANSIMVNGSDSFYIIDDVGVHTINHSDVDKTQTLPAIDTSASNSSAKYANKKITTAIFNKDKVYMAINKPFLSSEKSEKLAIFDTTTNTITINDNAWKDKENYIIEFAINNKGDVFALTEKEILKLDDKGNIIENIADKLDKALITSISGNFRHFAFVDNYLLLSTYNQLLIFSFK